ncbi:hypothetical protein BDN71DRAFT_283510 [Pleurotus eryngii]|uniref:Uncharacterized protein n=1 Tax=Pleurotus eryngii TaxID=5323 RepID=A0A9P6D2A0_PLEER|nr:hypothetical protein BDN71DRAFT_283510 [Pleurotus eryngii]
MEASITDEGMADGEASGERDYFVVPASTEMDADCATIADGEFPRFEMRLDLDTLTDSHLLFGIKMQGDHPEGACRISDMVNEGWRLVVTKLNMVPGWYCLLYAIKHQLSFAVRPLRRGDKRYPVWRSEDKFQVLGLEFTFFIGFVERDMVLLAVDGCAIDGSDPWITD